MKINFKIKISDRDKKYIEDSILKRKQWLLRNEINFKREQEKIQKSIENDIIFWENNEIPIYHQPSNEFNYNNAYRTKTEWADLGSISITTTNKLFGWVCVFCKREPRKKYIATGHDHTDYSYDICDCKGAQKFGKKYNELN